MMENLNDEFLEEYCVQHSDEEIELLKKMTRRTHVEIMRPRMLSGHIQGRLLAFISKIYQPKRVLELGSYTGYSAICLSEGLPNDGKLISIDRNEELEDFCVEFLQQSDKSEQIEFILGDAKKIIPHLDECFDLVFIDADKKEYAAYYDLVFDKVNKGGIIIADNVLWSGKIMDENPDKETKALQLFNLKIKNDKRVEKVILPFRDGLTLMRKL